MRVRYLSFIATFFFAGIAAFVAGCAGGREGPQTVPAVSATVHHSSAKEMILYSFASGSDGAYPYGSLLYLNGTFYGTTTQGGTSDLGTVYYVTTGGHESIVHSFAGGSDGETPEAGLVAVKDTLYGTTYGGGADEGGTVYKITKSESESVIHSFAGDAEDGADPVAGLTVAGGELYGTTVYGGSNSGSGNGTVYSTTLGGSETLRHDFEGSNGANPYAGLTDFKGTVYGTTDTGGASDDGTVFKVSKKSAFSVIHHFSGSDGANPQSPLIMGGKQLYGVTLMGGTSNRGVVFKMSSAGKEEVLHSFTGTPDGEYPYYGGLVDVDGTLYGTTSGGGANNVGCVFSITKSGKESVVYSFAGGSDGEFPFAGLIAVQGTLYGTTYSGGAYGEGTVFSISL
jgi:uncharacterized repeat protein (TIGR03803 family)